MRASQLGTSPKLSPSTKVEMAPNWVKFHTVRGPLFHARYSITGTSLSTADHYITRHSAVELKPFHKLCLDRPGNVISKKISTRCFCPTLSFNIVYIILQKLEIKKNLREFSGFTFGKDSDQYQKKKVSLGK